MRLSLFPVFFPHSTHGRAARTKRSPIALGHIILAYTNRSPTIFNGYGCWCGLGHKGGAPVDDIDE